jgi:hypothetical protein
MNEWNLLNIKGICFDDHKILDTESTKLFEKFISQFVSSLVSIFLVDKKKILKWPNKELTENDISIQLKKNIKIGCNFKEFIENYKRINNNL